MTSGFICYVGAMALGTSIVISGSGFSSEPTNNTVTIGGVSCAVTASTTSSVTCDIGVGPFGAHKIEVKVVRKGNAKHTSGDVTFSYDAAITSIDPTTGSQGGKVTVFTLKIGIPKLPSILVFKFEQIHLFVDVSTDC